MKKLYMLAVGYDVDAICKTIFHGSPDKACLLSTKTKPDGWRKESDERTQEAEQQIRERLNGLVELDVLHFSWGSYEDMIAEISDYLQSHRDWDVTLNLSFGSNRLTPVLLMLASLYGLRLEYTRMKEFRPELLKGDWHTGVEGFEELPTLPLRVSLGDKEREFLLFVREKQPASVQDYLSAHEADEAKVRAEYNYYAKKLDESGFVKLGTEGKRTLASLTPAGQLVLRLQL